MVEVADLAATGIGNYIFSPSVKKLMEKIYNI